MSRAEFTKTTKAKAFDRAKGNCECCGVKILGTPEYHHMVPAALGGGNDLDNCMVMDPKCHARQTNVGNGLRRGDKTEIAKAVRGFEKRIGAREKSGRPMFGSKRSGWRKPMSGPPVRRESR